MQLGLDLQLANPSPIEVALHLPLLLQLHELGLEARDGHIHILGREAEEKIALAHNLIWMDQHRLNLALIGTGHLGFR